MWELSEGMIAAHFNASSNTTYGNHERSGNFGAAVVLEERWDRELTSRLKRLSLAY
jgi:hypothetical protein